MALQYYNVVNTGKKYSLDKATGVATEVSSIPSGAATITWGGTGLPPDLQGKLPSNTPTSSLTAPVGMENPTVTSEVSPNGYIYGSDGSIKDAKTGAIIKKPRIPDSVYNQIRLQIQNGSLTPQQAQSHLQGLINSGEYSETVNGSKLYAALDNIQQSGGVYKFAGDGTDRLIKTAATPTYSGNFIEDKSSQSQVSNMLTDIIESVVGSGKVLNPNLTDEYLGNLDLATFLAQAEAEIAPEYKQKFDQVRTDLSTFFDRLGYDLNQELDKTNRNEKATRLAADEDFSGRGMTFSSRRERTNQDIIDQANRDRTSARTLAFRQAEDTGREAERLIGTENLSSLSLPTIGERRFELSSTPQIGTLQREKQYNVEQMARQLEFDERARRAYTTRSLSFA